MPGARIDGLHVNGTSSAHGLRELIPAALFSARMPAERKADTVKRWILESVSAAGRMRAAA